MLAGRLHEAIAAVCPISGVSIGKLDDPTTWKFHPVDATAEQIFAAQAVIDSIDKSPEADAEWLEDKDPEKKAVKGIASKAVADLNTIIADANKMSAKEIQGAVKRLAEIMVPLVRKVAK